MRDIIQQFQNDIAFIIGNGINRYTKFEGLLSWEELLKKLWSQYSNRNFTVRPKGLALTEFFDLLELYLNEEAITSNKIKKDLCELMSNWKGLQHHKKIVNKIVELNAPLLTLNFDMALLQKEMMKQFYIDSKKFTDYYVWNTYYGFEQLESPTDGFGVWFINGFIQYHRSIRLGLTDYMGSVHRARQMIHKADDGQLFYGKNQYSWSGKDTYLHIIFNKSLMIFGLALEENEVFLRWLLLERAKYYKKYPARKKEGWYVTTFSSRKDSNYTGKKFFLENIGIKVIEVSSYDDIYEKAWNF